MILIDIDQDFFFYPPLYKEDFEKKTNKKQNQVISIKDFVNRYNLRKKNYVIFQHHFQAYWYIKNHIGQIQKLLHFDAHFDLEGLGSSEELSIGNWISFLIKDGLCYDIDWIASNKEVFNKKMYKTQSHKILDKNYTTTLFDYENHSWTGDTYDTILFTMSSEFCPYNIVQNFIEEIE